MGHSTKLSIMNIKSEIVHTKLIGVLGGKTTAKTQTDRKHDPASLSVYLFNSEQEVFTSDRKINVRQQSESSKCKGKTSTPPLKAGRGTGL